MVVCVIWCNGMILIIGVFLGVDCEYGWLWLCVLVLGWVNVSGIGVMKFCDVVWVLSLRWVWMFLVEKGIVVDCEMFDLCCDE